LNPKPANIARAAEPILSERAFLGRLRRALPPPSKTSGLILGPGDDAALWRPRPGCEAALSCDLLAEGVHFNLETAGPWELGARAAAVNLSDLAAMGAQPRLFLASLAMPKRKGLGEAWLTAFHAGLHAWMGAFGAVPAGGDLSGSRSDLFIDITVLGEVEKGKALRRSAARPGDAVFISGPLGGSAAGLALLQRPALERRIDPGAAVLLKRRHQLPMPRILAGRWLLQERAARACIDISDGLASEAWHLSRESGVALRLDLDALPLAPGVAELAKALRRDPVDLALNGGEDYELLFTVPRSKIALVSSKMDHYAGCAPAQIGWVEAGQGVRARLDGRWRRLADGGYEHFKD
jgi:thiamine-monophosphate kinase